MVLGGRGGRELLVRVRVAVSAGSEVGGCGRGRGRGRAAPARHGGPDAAASATGRTRSRRRRPWSREHAEGRVVVRDHVIVGQASSYGGIDLLDHNALKDVLADALQRCLHLAVQSHIEPKGSPDSLRSIR